MLTNYCSNSPCDSEAIWFYTTDSGGRMHLCHTCKDAFELGQVNPEMCLLPCGEVGLTSGEQEQLANLYAEYYGTEVNDTDTMVRIYHLEALATDEQLNALLAPWGRSVESEFGDSRFWDEE